MYRTITTAAFVCTAALGLAACDVKKTEEGNVSVPKFEVQKTQEGSVNLPKYDVKGPDVQVGTTEKSVTVPTIKTEEKKIEVPTVSVTTAKEKEAQGK